MRVAGGGVVVGERGGCVAGSLRPRDVGPIIIFFLQTLGEKEMKSL